MGPFAAGNFVASQMKSISLKLENMIGVEVPVFWFIAIETTIVALVLLTLTPWLKRMMKGIS